jgi:hypothetical protein
MLLNFPKPQEKNHAWTDHPHRGIKQLYRPR